MHNQDNKSIGNLDSFEELFQHAEQDTEYWVELAKLEFTEEMLARMQSAGMKKGQLAASLGAKPAFVTRLVSGHNNFTLETMVRVARALNCGFRSHLEPAGTKACWIDVLKDEPKRPRAEWATEKFRVIETLHPDFSHEALPAAA
jgi:antitoxin component HigA of HigAB toxin-antitoxin module